MPGPVPLARVERGDIVESVHLGSVAVVDARGRLHRVAGDPGRVVFARSTMKPLQAAVSLDVAGEDLPDDEVAVMAASHNGEPRHLAVVRRILDRAGLDERALRCPPGLPLDAEAARTAAGPRPELHNCSGKHAGMLLACVRAGMSTATYLDPDHPLQRRILEAVVHAAGGEPRAVGVDGCGAPVHALTLAELAAVFARLPDGAAGSRVLRGMTAEPYLAAGRGRVCTAVMEAAPGIVVKNGAEGLMCALLLDRGLGVAVKVEDGATRAADVALIRALVLLEALPATALDALATFARPPVLGGGRPVGSVVARFDLASG